MIEKEIIALFIFILMLCYMTEVARCSWLRPITKYLGIVIFSYLGTLPFLGIMGVPNFLYFIGAGAFVLVLFMSMALYDGFLRQRKIEYF